MRAGAGAHMHTVAITRADLVEGGELQRRHLASSLAAWSWAIVARRLAPLQVEGNLLVLNLVAELVQLRGSIVVGRPVAYVLALRSEDQGRRLRLRDWSVAEDVLDRLVNCSRAVSHEDLDLHLPAGRWRAESLGPLRTLHQRGRNGFLGLIV